MLQNQFIHTITTSREIKGVQNSIGEKTETEEEILSSVPARIESEKAETQYRTSGQRADDYMVIYLQPQYTNILLQDKVFRTDLGGEPIYLGLIIGINPALSPNGKKLDHNELIIENP